MKYVSHYGKLPHKVPMICVQKNKTFELRDEQWGIRYCVTISIFIHYEAAQHTVQGWGLLMQFSPFRYFANFSALSKQTLAIEYPVYIWQVSPQLSCGDTCRIWTWFDESNMYFRHIENFAYGEINERSFSNPHPSMPRIGLGAAGWKHYVEIMPQNWWNWKIKRNPY